MSFFSRRRKGGAIFIILMVCLLILVYFTLIPPYPYIGNNTVVRGQPLPAKVNLRRIRDALYEYNHAYGTLPYDPRGPEYALYKLKPFVKDVNIFRMPSDLVDRILRPRPKPRWDDAKERVVNCDYGYLNEPDIRIEVPDPQGDLIILAEKTGLRKEGKYYLTKAGVSLWYSYEEGRPKDILGKYAHVSDSRVHDTPEEAEEKNRHYTETVPR